MATLRSASQPPREKLPVDPEVPRKLNVSTTQPVSAARRAGRPSPSGSDDQSALGADLDDRFHPNRLDAVTKPDGARPSARHALAVIGPTCALNGGSIVLRGRITPRTPALQTSHRRARPPKLQLRLTQRDANY